jgi:hypothetical protein
MGVRERRTGDSVGDHDSNYHLFFYKSSRFSCAWAVLV